MGDASDHKMKTLFYLDYPAHMATTVYFAVQICYYFVVLSSPLLFFEFLAMGLLPFVPMFAFAFVSSNCANLRMAQFVLFLAEVYHRILLPQAKKYALKNYLETCILQSRIWKSVELQIAMFHLLDHNCEISHPYVGTIALIFLEILFYEVHWHPD